MILRPSTLIWWFSKCGPRAPWEPVTKAHSQAHSRLPFLEFLIQQVFESARQAILMPTEVGEPDKVGLGRGPRIYIS